MQSPHAVYGEHTTLTSAGFNGLLPHSLAHQVILVESGSVSCHIHRLGGITSPDVRDLRLGVGI